MRQKRKHRHEVTFLQLMTVPACRLLFGAVGLFTLFKMFSFWCLWSCVVCLLRGDSPQTAVGSLTCFCLSRVLSGEDVKCRYHRQRMSRRETRVVCENTSMCHVMSFALLPPPDLFPLSYHMYGVFCDDHTQGWVLLFSLWTWKVDDLKCGAAANWSAVL